MAFRDLAETLGALRALGRLVEVDGPVSPRHEIAAVLDREPGRAVLLTRVRGHGVPVAGNVIHSRRVLALTAGVEPGALAGETARRAARPIAPRAVERAPVEERDASDTPLGRVLPILTHYEGDCGPYITTALISARDPDTGAVARGIHRMELRGDRELGAALLNPPLSDLYARHRERGQPMPAAVVVGVEPLTFTAFAVEAPAGTDKLAVAGGLRAEPVEVVAAGLTGIDVPAHAEFLLEGEVDPSDERDDGPMGEIGGYAGVFPRTPTFRVRRITHRQAPVYHALLPDGPDGDLLLALATEIRVAAALPAGMPEVLGFHVVPRTLGSSVVIRVAEAPGARVREILARVLDLSRVKKAVAVAEDVGPADPAGVEWSMAVRFQASRDLLVVPEGRGLPIDPSCPAPFRTSKLGIDATGYERVRGHRRATIPRAARARAETLLSREKNP